MILQSLHDVVSDALSPLNHARQTKCLRGYLNSLGYNPAQHCSKNEYGQTPLHLAILSEANQEFLELLVTTELQALNEDEVGKSSLHLTDNGGQIPLHLAVVECDLECVKEVRISVIKSWTTSMRGSLTLI